MAPQSRGKKAQRGSFSHSLSTPNLPTFRPFETSTQTSPEERPPTSNIPDRHAHGHNPPTTHSDVENDELEEDDDADFQSHYSQDAPSYTSASASSVASSDNDDPEPLTTTNTTTTHNDPTNAPHDRHPPRNHSTSSLLSAHAFAPPFYNRPPTPLPPSPSLTSLLRPPFSTTTSRPTTPDSSDIETPNDTEAAVAKSARTATTVPRASPKVPTYEYYGFVLYLTSSLAFLGYVLWSYLPSPFLHQLGIYYYPNRWWSLAIPSFLVMSIVYIYVALASYNVGYLTLPMASVENVVDEAANVAVVDAKGRILAKRGRGRGGERGKEGAKVVGTGRAGQAKAGGVRGKLDWRTLWNEGTDAVMDVPVGGVCEILYGEGRESDAGDSDGGFVK